MRVVVLIQLDVDYFKAADSLEQFVYCDFLLLNALKEIEVIYGEVGIANVLCGIAEQLSERLAVVLDGLELYPRVLVLILVHKVFRVDLLA